MTETIQPNTVPGSLEVKKEKKGQVRFTFQGRLDSDNTGSLWKQASQVLERDKPHTVVVEAGQVEYCDGAGVGLLLSLEHHQKQAQGSFKIQGLAEKFQQLMQLHDPGDTVAPPPKPGVFRRVNEDVGKGTVSVLDDMRSLVTFTGELAAGLFSTLLHPRRLRWKDTFLVVEMAGPNAFGIVIVVSFLLGLILAFQSAIPLKAYGAQIFVINIVGISVTRELGPLITAIILAGRTGSAFAAELGTMKVNEELNALNTMGLDPVRFLITPRVLATVCVTPILVIFSNLFAIMGCLLVMQSFGYTMVTCVNQLQSAVGLSDVFSGLFKSLFFGLLVAAIGCLRGMQTATGAQAVGVSATRAVVSGIFLILLADSVFAVVFTLIGI